ncbi:P1 family peptidase [Oricola cellulosilytica]|uniref:S58 family peptidase n=1 Tax=Oricola cellulosilytica TaxID=1429082 RepID=A0A4V2MNU5_9HYPH|nr:P1 family peptidase [Oricola cellulosilytica]TCD14637.1 S58 family peptidase [Oricola cellulosilytica]
MWPSGNRNLITDVTGIRVGNASDTTVKTGVTAVLCESPATAAVQVLGGAPGTRETDLLEPHNAVETVDALILSGGSAFGLDAASGAQAALVEIGRGFDVGGHRIPIVPAAILFDMINGGEKNWGRFPPYRELGYKALKAASADFEIGTHGAGTGALTANLKGGLGSASSVMEAGNATVGALVAVNPLGATTVGTSRHFWAAPFEQNGEFGGIGVASPFPDDASCVRLKHRETDGPAIANTTIGVIATDATLTKAECKRLAIAAHDGFARAIWPCHTPHDGDLVFALATGRRKLSEDPDSFIQLCAAAASTMARAIARGVYAAISADGDIMPTWSQKH